MDTLGLDFETAMVRGGQAHAEGDLQEALRFRLVAFNSPEVEPFDRARAARDVAATFDKLGRSHFWVRPSNQTLAEEYSRYAYREHESLAPILINDPANREFTVSAMYRGIIAARRTGGVGRALSFVRVGWLHSQMLRIYNDGRPHQYDVNLIGRVAGLEGYAAEKPKEVLRSLGKEALELARISETSEVLGHNPSLNLAGIKAAQVKAKQRAWGAKAIIEMQSSPIREITKPIAWILLQKVVL